MSLVDRFVLTAATAKKAANAAKDMSPEELRETDAELGRRAAALGRPDAVTPAHKAIRNELKKLGNDD